MAQISYVPLGHGMSSRLGRFLESVSQLPPYRWSLGVLRRLGFTGRTAVIAVPWLWLALFFFIPFLIVLKISFADTQLSVPPYTPLLEWGKDGYIHFKMNLANFAFILKESLY